ncbi:MAG: nucleoid-associated protein [Bacteroidota bacterium]
MQFNLTDAVLQKVSVHFIGNKGNGQDLVTSKKPIDLDVEDRRRIKDGFLTKFNLESDKYAFHHLTSLDYNEVYNYCLESLAEGDTFHKNSANIARHLYEATTHPKIKNGELYVCYYENCLVHGAFVDAIGLYKTETKNDFLDLAMEEGNFSLTMRNGVEVTKFDKGCLVFPTNAEAGFDVLIYDSNNKGEEAAFWRETFLNVLPQATEYYQTNQFLDLTRQFIAKQLPQEYDIAKTDQIDLLNKSVEYFRANEAFDKKKFEKEVFEDGGMIKAFRQFEHSYSEMNDVDLPDQFDISTQAVKKQARVFKSVLKLDKNFHVYIHGDKDLIEKGYDERMGKSYYKIYFDEEN